MVEKYARENGISEYVNVLLAIIQVESGGTAEDVMQSSESLGLPPNSLDTESSIKQPLSLQCTVPNQLRKNLWLGRQAMFASINLLIFGSNFKTRKPTSTRTKKK